MEPVKKSSVLEVFGPWLHLSVEPPFKPAFRPVDIAVFASSGFTCGLAISNLLHAYLGPHGGTLGSTALIISAALFQVTYFAIEQRRMKAMHEEIKAGAMRLGEMVRDAPPEATEGSRSVH
jgi:hypothetical protein